MDTADSSKVQERRKKEWKKIIFLWVASWAFLLGILIFLILFFEHAKGKHDLKAWMEAMKSKGEKFTVEEIHPGKAPRENNGAEALLKAADQLKALNSSCFIASDSVPSMKMMSPGRAAVLFDLPELPFWAGCRYPNKNKGKIPWNVLAGDLEKGGAALEQVREALKQPNLGMDLDYRKAFELRIPYLTKMRNVARWLSSSAMFHLHEGNLSAASEDLRAIASETRFHQDENVLISQLVRYAEGAIGLGVTWQSLQANGWTDLQLGELQSSWEMAPWSRDLEKSLEMERVAFGMSSFERLRKTWGIQEVWELCHNPLEDDSKNPTWLKRLWLGVYFKIWRFAWSEQSELRLLKEEQVLIDAVRAMENSKSWKRAKEAVDRETLPAPSGFYDRSKYLFSGSLSQALERSILTLARFETQREMTVAAIALKRYDLKNGKYPQTLQELVPDFLKELPVDFMNGEPLHYKLNSDGTFTLYSVGENGVDDGGDPTNSTEKNPSIFQGKDIVWPQPASIQEVENYKP